MEPACSNSAFQLLYRGVRNDRVHTISLQCHSEKCYLAYDPFYVVSKGNLPAATNPEEIACCTSALKSRRGRPACLANAALAEACSLKL